MNAKNIIISGILAVAVCAGIVGLLSGHSTKKVGDITAMPFFTASNSNITCGPNSASTVAIATSTSRFFLRVSNTSGAGIFLGLGSPATSTAGLTVFAGTGYQFDQNSLFSGAIYCYAAATTTLPTVEFK